MEWKFDGEGEITNIAKLNRVKSIDPELEERVLWRRETNKNIESGESVCSRASYNYSTLVTIQCLLKVRDFVARFLRATSKMASSAGLFACGQSFWPVVLHTYGCSEKIFSLESNLVLSNTSNSFLLESPSSGFGLLNNAPPPPSRFVEIT